MMKRLVPVFVMPFLMVTIAAANAGVQSHASIQGAVKHFLTSNLRHPDQAYEIHIEPLDRRLRLAQCAQPLAAFSPPGGKLMGSTTVGVHCHGPKPWTIYTQVQIKVFQKVVVLAKALPRDAIIAKDALTLHKKDLARLRQGFLTHYEQALGKQLKRPLPAGSVLTTVNLAAPKLIKRGQKVIIHAHTPGFDIRMAGDALMDGEKGQRIRVRNDQSQRIVEGIVIAPGIIRVTL